MLTTISCNLCLTHYCVYSFTVLLLLLLIVVIIITIVILIIVERNRIKRTVVLDPSAEFDNWFTWCQSCRHGGHSIHIEEWFRSNVECPVSGCDCKCASLDSIPPLEQLNLGT